MTFIQEEFFFLDNPVVSGMSVAHRLVLCESIYQRYYVNPVIGNKN